MRFDDDTAAPTMLVRTPPSYEGERVTYEVSDEYVNQAISAVRDVLGDSGEQPLVGRIDAPTVDEFEDGASQYRDENPTADPLADYATALSLQAHEQKTGERLDESGRFDLDDDVRAAFHGDVDDETHGDVDDEQTPAGDTTEKPKRQTAAQKRAAAAAAAKG